MRSFISPLPFLPMLLAPVAILLGIFLSPYPETFVGFFLGSYVRNARSLLKILFSTSEYFDVSNVHPQLHVLDYVLGPDRLGQGGGKGDEADEDKRKSRRYGGGFGIFTDNEGRQMLGQRQGQRQGDDNSANKTRTGGPRRPVPQGDLQGVIDAIDEFAWSGNMLISVGNTKGRVLRNAVREKVREKIMQDFAMSKSKEEKAASSISTEDEAHQETSTTSGTKEVVKIRIMEFGTFLGYGTMQMISGVREALLALLDEDKMRSDKNLNVSILLESVDPSPLSHAASTALLHRAGVLGDNLPCLPADEEGPDSYHVSVSGRGASAASINAKISSCTLTVRLRKEFSTDILLQEGRTRRETMKRKNYIVHGVGSIDILFLDHVKELYLSDLRDAALFSGAGLLAPGAVVIADNILKPGAPDYKKWVLEYTMNNVEVAYDPDTRHQEVLSRTPIENDVLNSKIMNQTKSSAPTSLARKIEEIRHRESFCFAFESTEVHRLHVEYWPNFADEIMVSKLQKNFHLDMWIYPYDDRCKDYHPDFNPAY
ncbi:unnamed protein product [Amoebophrya sp. A25]|nr:unnamed protein product [Amoebophrya sp. A25]|eukprot:GSA25T00025070001.1